MTRNDAHRDPSTLAEALRSGDRTALARAITLVESHRDDDQELAYELLRRVMPETGRSHRAGISGPPGVGKSTLIDAFGMHLIGQGHQVAVLAIDPSSSRSGGSILGDKSRMARLAQADGAFIRPSPSDLALGGVTRRTRESMLLCEAAGFDRVLIETVGVGQSEIQVAGMVDTFLVLIQPGSGDELQGIKKGIIELADILAVNKADGDNLGKAREAKAEYSAALRYLRPKWEAWKPQALAVSGLTGAGVDDLAELVAQHLTALSSAKQLAARRREDLERWIRELTEEAILRRFRQEGGAGARFEQHVEQVQSGQSTARTAASNLAQAKPFDDSPIDG